MLKSDTIVAFSKDEPMLISYSEMFWIYMRSRFCKVENRILVQSSKGREKVHREPYDTWAPTLCVGGGGGLSPPGNF